MQACLLLISLKIVCIYVLLKTNLNTSFPISSCIVLLFHTQDHPVIENVPTIIYNEVKQINYKTVLLFLMRLVVLVQL